MAKIIESREYSIEDIERYRGIALAAEMVKAKNPKGLESALTQFNLAIGVPKKEAGDIASATLRNPKDFLEGYSAKYQKARESATIAELLQFYYGIFEKYFSEKNLPKALEKFRGMGHTTYKELREKYEAVREIADSKTTNFTDEQKENAKKKATRLEQILVPIETSETIEIEKLKAPVSEAMHKQMFNALYEEELAEAA